MIKLKSLIRINEQAPQPMPGMGGGMDAPVPMGAPPIPGSEPQPEEQPAPVSPETDETPSPEDPGEYDWTKDFRAFEDAKNKAEAQAKKKLLDKMNKSLIGKKVTTNASRGYGQPKTDHTIEKVKKVNVEFWYKEWVVILQDENDKKYFLTPGVNIKVEGGEEGMPTDDQAPTEPEGAATGATGEEEPNATPGPEAGAPPMPGAEMAPPEGMAPPGGEMPMADPNAAAVPPAVPGQPAAPVAQPPAQQPPPPPAPVAPKKKKRVAEINEDLKSFLSEYMINENTNFTQYIKGIKSAINESRGASVYKTRIEIPVDHMKKSTDIRDIQLSVKNALWESGNVGQRFSRGSIEISRVGRVYLMEYTKENGWK